MPRPEDPVIRRVTRNTLGDALRRSAARTPEKLALVFGERRHTFTAFDQAVDRVARQLLDLGLKTGDRVAAYGKNSDVYAMAFLACARAGLIHVPVNFALTGDELAYILGQCGARAVLYDPELEAPLTQVRGRVGAEHYLRLNGPAARRRPEPPGDGGGRGPGGAGGRRHRRRRGDPESSTPPGPPPPPRAR